ncbi:unnamed protein product [Eruca vesicaria subsp. sativa]|uniref:Uncharacterized protein n=1 Tax=Eruca vesicaria subsp. sativa TaxID=29727 RepID=A0ABC8KGL8_ERUVS|nr:unnamed protein product [Eruca vesicaria subsp. sativa]
MDESKAMFPPQIRSESSPPDIKALSLSVFFNGNNLFKEDAWDEYNKPIDGLTLYIPSRSEVAESLKPINIRGGDDDDDTSEHVPSGSKKRKSMKPTPLALRNKNKAMCSSDENHNPPKVVPLVEVLQNLGKEFPAKLKRSRYLGTPTSVRSEIADSGGPASREVPLNELFQKEVVKRKSEHLEEKRACMDCYDNITTTEMVIDREANEAGRTLVLSPSDGNNLSSPPVGFDGETGIAVSPPETMPTCDDEMNVHGSNADESTMMDDGSTAAYCLLNEAGILARDDGEETEPRVEENNEGRSEAAEINIPIPSDGNNSSAPPLASEGASEDEGSQAHKSMGLSSSDKSSTHVNVGDQTHENGQGSEDTVKSQEELEDIGTRDDEGGVGNDSIKQSFLSIEEMAKDIEERIMKTQKRVRWLKAMKVMKQRKVTSARLI